MWGVIVGIGRALESKLSQPGADGVKFGSRRPTRAGTIHFFSPHSDVRMFQAQRHSQHAKQKGLWLVFGLEFRVGVVAAGNQNPK